jgi:GTPase SAR1 family protein
MNLAKHPLKSKTELLDQLTSKLDLKVLENRAQLLDHRLELPSAWVTFIGETSCGKSTIINSFLGEKLIPTSATPSTGTVIQIVCANPEDGNDQKVDEFEMIATEKDGSVFIESDLDRNFFASQATEPADNLNQLILRTTRKGPDWAGLQICDTPGYNSLTLKHKDVFTNFIPNCDVIVLVVGYRTGFRLVEMELLGQIKDVNQDLDSPPPVILVVNRTPVTALSKEDKRIKEIISFASDAFQAPFETVVLPSIRSDKDQDDFVPIDTRRLFEQISVLAFSAEASAKFEASCRRELIAICDESEKWLSQKIIVLENQLVDRDAFVANLNELKDMETNLLTRVNSFFDKLKVDTCQRLASEIGSLKRTVTAEINSSGKWTEASECSTYCLAHILPHGVKQITKILDNFIKSELDELNKDIEDMINASMRRFNVPTDLKGPEISKVFEDICLNLILNIGKFAAIKAMEKMAFTIGSSAVVRGIGTAALKGAVSKGLANTSSRLITSSLLSKLNVGLTVLIEGCSMVYHANTWKGEISEKIDSRLNDLKDPSINDSVAGQYESYLEDLRNANLIGISSILKERREGLNKLFAITNPNEISGKINELKSLISEFATLKAKV